MRRLAVLIIAFTFILPLAAQQPQQPQQQQQKAQEITPAQLWSALLAGNKEFVGGKLVYDNLKQERDLLRNAQLPPVTVLACSDSRVPPELIFNQSLGTLFVVRTAGNVADDFGVASIELAIQQGYTRLIVVLGHENCGAVKGSLGGADPDSHALRALATRIRSSFVGIPYDSRDVANLYLATQLNARASAAQLLAASKVIRDAVLTDRVMLISAYYDLASGEVKPIK